MLSAEDTIILIIDILRRVVNSNEMKKSILKNDEFIKLVNLIRGAQEISQDDYIKLNTNHGINFNKNNNYIGLDGVKK